MSSYFIALLSLPTVLANIVISIQPPVIQNTPTVIHWTRTESPRSPKNWRLRITSGDVAILPDVPIRSQGDLTGVVNYTFLNSGSFEMRAVDGPSNKPVDSAPVSVDVLPSNSMQSSPSSAGGLPSSQVSEVMSSTLTLASTTLSSAEGANPTSTVSDVPNHSSPSVAPASTSSGGLSAASKATLKLPSIVGGLVAGIVLLGVLALCAMLFVRRRRKAQRHRITFNGDLMVHRRSSLFPELRNRPNDIVGVQRHVLPKSAMMEP